MKVTGPDNSPLIGQYQEIQAMGKGGRAAEGVRTASGDDARPAADATERRRDRLDISSEAQALQRFLMAVEALPDVREERVEAIRKAIRSGNYRVSGEDVAEKMMQAGLNRERGGNS